ncbi:MAG: hypothetical protein CMJ58_27785 [Planctomycetaceae bacterium]|nr:hypothetical protein [Planctomycetaceae bacterium]
MQISLKTLLLLPVLLSPVLISYLLMDSSGGAEAVVFLLAPIAIYSVVITLALSTGERRHWAVFKQLGSTGIGALAGLAFVLQAVVPWFVDVHLGDGASLGEMLGAFAQFAICGVTIGAACGAIVRRLTDGGTRAR